MKKTNNYFILIPSKYNKFNACICVITRPFTSFKETAIPSISQLDKSIPVKCVLENCVCDKLDSSK